MSLHCASSVCKLVDNKFEGKDGDSGLIKDLFKYMVGCVMFKSNGRRIIKSETMKKKAN